MADVIIVGVGALGSHLLLLSRNFEAEFTIVDFDRVEQKNTLSQFHTRMSLNRNKAQALQQSMVGLFGSRNITSIPHRLTEENADILLGSRTLVIDCLDNADSRKIIQDTVRKFDVPCLHGALAADGQFGSIIWDEHFKIDAEDVAGQPTCEGGGHLPFIGLVASVMASKIQKFLSDGTRAGCHIHPGGIINL